MINLKVNFSFKISKLVEAESSEVATV